MLHKLHDPKLALADKLSALDGINSWKTAKASGAHAATLNVYGTTDRIESNFGGVDNVMHTFRQIAPEHASGMQVENRQKHLAMPTDWVKHRTSKQQKGVLLLLIYINWSNDLCLHLITTGLILLLGFNLITSRCGYAVA